MPVTNVRHAEASNGAGTIPITNGGTIAVGDLLVALFTWPLTNAKANFAIADNVNTGAWNLPASLNQFVFGNQQTAIGWIRCDTVGTPTVTASSLGTQGTIMELGQYTGFATGNPAFVTADTSFNSGTSTSPSSGALTNSNTNEVIALIAACAGGQNFGSVTGSFTGRDGFGSGTAGTAYGDAIETTSGNALTFGATITSVNWSVLLAGFADNPPPVGVPVAWWV